MSLLTLTGGFLPVAVLFLLGAWAAAGRKPGRALALAALGEAVALTLLAALWFGSLGHGGWLIVFLLLGTLVGLAEAGLRLAFPTPGVGAGARRFVVALVRYVAAGALLAWRLG